MQSLSHGYSMRLLTTTRLAVFAAGPQFRVPLVWNLAAGYQIEVDGSIPKVLEINDKTARKVGAGVRAGSWSRGGYLERSSPSPLLNPSLGVWGWSGDGASTNCPAPFGPIHSGSVPSAGGT